MSLPPKPSPSATPPRRRRLRRIAIALTLAGVGIAFFDWNLLRGPIAQLASDRLAREVQLAGPLIVRPWRLHPAVSVEGVKVANLPGGKATSLASARRVAVSLDLLALLRGEWVFDTLEVEGAELHLEDGPDGRGNWRLGRGEASGGGTVRLGAVRIRDSRLSVDLPSQRTALTAQLATGDDGQIHLSAQGRWRGEALAISGHAGSVPTYVEGRLPFPLDVKGTIGATRFRLNGTAADLAGLNGLDVDFELSGRSLAELYPLTGVPLPATPAYRLAAKLSQAGQIWHFGHIDGRIGNSDVAGTFAVDRTPSPQRLTGSLRAKRLDLADLSGFIGARDKAGEAVAPQPGKVLPSQPLGFEKIAAADVDLDFAVGDLRNTGLPLDAAAGHLRILDREVQLKPLRVGLAHGEVSGELTLDTRGRPATARLDVQASRVKLRELMPTLESKALSTGSLGGRVQLAMRGDSVARLLGSADGTLAVAMDGGSTSRLLVRLANLDLANAVGAWLAGGQKEDIRCLVGDFTARDGVLAPRTLLLDTERTLIRGEGQISLRDETLDLHLRAAAKDASLLSLRGPLHLTGSFADPRVTPEPLPLGRRVAGAIALGLISPPLALLPLLETGGAEDSACARLLDKTAKTIRKP